MQNLDFLIPIVTYQMLSHLLVKTGQLAWDYV